MFFRFGSAIVLVVLTSLAGIGLQKRILDVRRDVSRQHYRMDALRRAHATLRWKTQKLGAPARVIDSLEHVALPLKPSAVPAETDEVSIPLLHWARPTPRTNGDLDGSF